MSTTSAASTPSSPLLPVPAPVAPAPLTAPPPLKGASIADRVARAFPPLACVRGFRYFARRRVDLADVSESGLDADVKGTRMQHVRLRIDDGRLASACTCAAKVLGPAACRHVWATLLEVDRQGALPGLRGTQRVLALSALDAPPKRKKPPVAAAPAKTTGKSERPGKTTERRPKSAKPPARARSGSRGGS